MRPLPKEMDMETEKERSSSSSFQITGAHALLFDDDTLAAFVDSPDALLPWNGDPSLLIDRFDVRHLIQDLSGVRRRRPAPPLEPGVSEEDLAYERFRDLHEKVTEEEEVIPHLRHSLQEPLKTISGNSHYQAVPFSYSSEETVNVKAEETSTKIRSFVPPFPVPDFLQSKLPGSQKLHQIMAGTAKFVSEHGGQSEFLLKVKQGDNPMFGFLNSDHHLHEYYRYLVQHPELLRPVSGSNAEPKSIGGEGLSLLGSAYGTGDDDDDEDNGNVNNNDKEGDLGRLKNVKESVSAPSAHVGEVKSKESGANGLAAMDKVSSSSRFLKGAGSKASKVVSKEPGQLEKKKKIIAGAKEYIPPNKTILPDLKDTKAKSKSKSEKEHKDNMLNRPSSRFEPRGSWESVPNKEYGMSADAAAAVVLAATRGTRGIIKQDSNKSSSGLSQRVFSNGGSHGPSMNDNEVTVANAMAQAAALAASREADSADSLLTPAEKLKAERLRRAKMFAAMIKSGKCSSEIDFELPGTLGVENGTTNSINVANGNEPDAKNMETKNDASHLINRKSSLEEVEENRVKESEPDSRGTKSKKSHRHRKHSRSDSEHDDRSSKKRSHRRHRRDKHSKQKRHDSDSSDAEDREGGSKVSDEDCASYKQRKHHHSKREHSRTKKDKKCKDDQADSEGERKKHRKIRMRDQSDSDKMASGKQIKQSQTEELNKEILQKDRSQSPSLSKAFSLSSDLRNPGMTMDVPADIRAKVREMLLSTL